MLPASFQKRKKKEEEKKRVLHLLEVIASTISGVTHDFTQVTKLVYCAVVSDPVLKQV